MPSPAPVTIATRSCKRPLMFASSLLGIPERAPRGPDLGHGAHPVGVLGPVGGRQRERIHSRFGSVPEAMHSTDEEPPLVVSRVRVVVEDRLVDPAVARLDLALAVHRS